MRSPYLQDMSPLMQPRLAPTLTVRAAAGVMSCALLAAVEIALRGDLQHGAALFAGPLLAGLWGFVVAAVAATCSAVARRTGVSERLEDALNERFIRHSQRARSHARAIAQLSMLTLLVASAPFLNARLAALQAADVAQALSVFVLLSSLIGAALGASLIEALLTRAFEQLGWPAFSPHTSFAIYLGALLGLVSLVSAGLLIGYGDMLGVVAVVPYTAIVGSLYLALVGLLGMLRSQVRGRLSFAWLTLWIAGLSATLAGVAMTPTVASRLDETLATASLAAKLRTLSDFDHDGDALWLGGHDCAPFDKRRYSGARDLPKNGIDEDCNGRDETGQKQKASDSKVMLAPLTASLVKPYNVIWIVIDSLRADHVHALGYRRKTTPNLDRLAAQGWLFENAFSQAAATQISFPSFFTGTSPVALDWQRKGSLQVASHHTTVAERLKARGYRTAFLYNGWIDEHMQGAMQGFDRKESAWPDRREWRKWRSMSAASTLGSGLHFIEETTRAGKKPFFLTLYFEDPHAPYERYTRSDVPSFGNREQDRFDQEIAFADRHVGVLLDYLRFRPKVWDNTIIVVTADHGEEFGEHGEQHHGHSCHIESTHVPLIVRIPDEKPQRSEAPVGLVDIAPTLLERVGAIKPPTYGDGRSLRWALAATPDEMAARPLFCTVFNDMKVASTLRHAVRSRGSLLIKSMATGQVQLFDTRTDPKELKDVASNPSYAAELATLRALLERAIKYPPPR